MRRIVRGSERGDTIIEVMFAIVIFTFVAISSIAIMNQGIATGEKALEITLVRQEVDAQAEAVRFIHETRIANPSSSTAETWETIIEDHGKSQASEYGVQGGECSVPPESDRPFVLNTKTASLWQGELKADYSRYEDEDGPSFPPYSQVVYDPNNPMNVLAAYGIWVEAVQFVPEGDDPEKPYVDFHIRACWPAPGSEIPMTIGTIVRLYDPSR